MAKDNLHVIVGLGKTGLSCARFLAKGNVPFALTDSRNDPPNLQVLKSEFPTIQISLGAFDKTLMQSAKTLVVSPGVPLDDPAVSACFKAGIPVIGDIELFAREVKAQVVGITGSNAKGTVTTLVGNMAKAAVVNVLVGGNIGTPALDLLSQPLAELYVLELSSFQLDTTYSLKATAATILNISVDHLDRHKTLEEYVNAKQRIYRHCHAAIYNRDDPHTQPTSSDPKLYFTFGLSTPQPNEFGLISENNEVWLAQGNTKLLSTNELLIKGKHNWANALAALALGTAIQLPMSAMLQALKEFKGLPHRCQWVAKHNGVEWYNDSKGTNVGATLAAIEGLSHFAHDGKIILIAGGQGKGADFSTLCSAIKSYVREIILIGEDAPLLEKAWANTAPIQHAKSMHDAVHLANQLVKMGDIVLLSPACASFDMFKNYEHRGEVFTSEVKGLLA